MTLDNFPNADPSIVLDFQKSRQLDPRITFSRASDASPAVPSPGTGIHNGEVYLYPGNVPRLTEQGLLIEESRTNQLPHSEDYSNWTLWNTTTAPSVSETAPDGSTTCRKLTEGDTDAFTLMGEGSDMADSTTYTFSFYIKQPGTDAARFCLVRTQANSSPEICTIDMDTLDAEGKPTVNSPSTPVATNIDFDILSNGWFRFYCTFPCNDAGTNREVQIGINETNSISLETYTGDGTSGFLIWGAQLEEGGFPTSYIPTTGQAAGVTRAADVCEITGTNFSSWYNQNAGTFVAEGQSFGTQNGLLTVWGTNTNDRMVLGGVSANWQYQVRDDGTVEAELDSGSYDQTAFNKLAAAYQANNFGLSANGSTTVTDNNGDLPTISRLQVAQLNGALYNSYVNRISYYPTRVSDDALQALTTND